MAARPDSSNVALFWIPGGFALGLVFLYGYWLAWGIFLAVVAVDLFVGNSLIFSAGVATANTAAVLVAVHMLRSFGHFRPSLTRARDVSQFLIAVTAGCIVGGIIGGAVVTGVGPGRGPAFVVAATKWCFSESLSLITFAPFYLANFSERRRREPWGAERHFEAGVLAVLMAVGSYFVFLDSPTDPGLLNRISLLLPLFLWASLRFEPRTTSIFIKVMAIVAVTGSLLGRGAFSTGPLYWDLLEVQFYIAIYCVSVMIVTAVSCERAALAQEREGRLRQIANSIPQLVWTADPAGLITFANEKCVSFFGATLRAELEGFWNTFVHPEDRRSAVERWERCLRSGEHYSDEIRLRRVDGEYHWFLCQASPLKDEHGTITQWFGAAMNIDQQREALAQLEEEKHIRDRMVFTLSHDIRNPLSIIGAGAQVLLKAPPPPDLARKFLEQISQNVQRANRMIVDLLDANRLRTGGLVALKVEAFDLAELLRDTLADLKTIHGDVFKLAAPPSMPGYWGSDEVRRIVENLCANAVKYGDSQRGISVTLEDRDNGRDVALMVHNYGSVIPPEERGRIFHLFHRTQDSLEGDSKGWGIGLTLVQGFTLAHGGRVEVASTAETGTTFTVLLPRDARSTCRRPVMAASS